MSIWYFLTRRCHSLSCLVHQRSLPTLTRFCLLHPRTTSYWKRYVLIPLVTSETTISIVDWSHKLTRALSVCFVFACFLRNFLKCHPSQHCSKLITLNYNLLMEWAIKKNMCFVGISSTKKFLHVFFQSCSLIFARARDPSRSDVNFILFAYKLQGVTHCHALCTIDHSLSSLVSSVMCFIFLYLSIIMRMKLYN